MFYFPDAESLAQFASLQWQALLPTFLDYFKIAEISLSSQAGEERPDSIL